MGQIQGIGPLKDDIALFQAIGHVEDAHSLLPDPFHYHHITRKSALIGQPSLRSGFSRWKDQAPEEPLPGKAILLAQTLQDLLGDIAIGGSGHYDQCAGVDRGPYGGVDRQGKANKPLSCGRGEQKLTHL